MCHILGYQSLSSHRTRIERKLGWELHRSRESKGIHIEYGVVRVQELRHGVVSLGPLGIAAHLQPLWLLAKLVLVGRLLLVHLVLRRERFGVRAWAGFGWILVIDHVGLRIVLLFCTHGINLGRT
jgi:hypothetical protein